MKLLNIVTIKLKKLALLRPIGLLPERRVSPVAISVNTTAEKENAGDDKGRGSDDRRTIAVGKGDGYEAPDAYKRIFAHVSPPGHEKINCANHNYHDDSPGRGRDPEAIPLYFHQPGGDVGDERHGDPAGVEAEGPPYKGNGAQGWIG